MPATIRTRLLLLAGLVVAGPSHAQTPNETWYRNGALWGVYGDASAPANPFGSQAAEAWQRGHADCSNVYVGVIGDGLMISHEDLAANAGRNPGDATFDGVDNDGNGHVDDVHGWDFLDGDNTVSSGLHSDEFGTALAGVIGAVGNNRKGVVGVCWRVRILAARVVSLADGTPEESTAAVVRALDYMTGLRQRGVNLVATVNAWGEGYSAALSSHDAAIQAAIDRAGAANVLFVTSSGYDGVNLDSVAAKPWQGYPARYGGNHVIAVAGIDAQSALMRFANRGTTSVDVGAPGVGIRTTVPTWTRGKLASGYALSDFVAPGFVAGAAALYRAYHPTATAAQIRAAIVDGGVPTPALMSTTASGRRLNAEGF